MDAVVREIAASGNAIVARPIIEDAVKQNPGDPSLMKLQWLILLAIKDYKSAELFYKFCKANALINPA